MDWEKIKEDGWKLKNENEVRILSIDGGGIRGIFPAKYLAEIESVTGKRINEFFDLIVGTSTGGIIALGLSVGIEAEKIMELYEKNAEIIFKPKKFSFWGLLRSKYDNKELEKLLKYTFKNKKIKDSEVMLCIPSVEFNNSIPKVYKTPHNKDLYLDGEKELWRVALATSAAPVYFPAVNVFKDECNIDGGLWANNPTIIGVSEALKNNCKLENIKVLSIGTGESISHKQYNIAKISSILKWREKIIDLILKVQSKSTVNIAKYILGENFTEINAILSEKIKLDSIDKDSIQSLLNAGRTEFQNSYRIGKNIESKFFE